MIVFAIVDLFISSSVHSGYTDLIQMNPPYLIPSLEPVLNGRYPTTLKVTII